MEKKYSLWERILSDTPAFFKRVQTFGISLATLGVTLTQVQGVPAQLTITLISSGTAIASVAQFAVKQCNPESFTDHGHK